MTTTTDMPDDSNDDVFTQTAPPIVDCDLLEASKENIQPLASGRRVTTLAAVLSIPHAQRDVQLRTSRIRFRHDVDIALADEDDDPLEAYCRFVYWTVENYPQGHSAESGLLELLEEATRVLKDDRDGQWRGDLKYLKLWVLYATYVEKPSVIYKFLLANDIGTDHSLLYEEYAVILERDGHRTAADDAYLLGIARQAFPVERLRNKHREFQKRMMSAAPLPAASSAAEAPSTKRTVLGTTSASSTTTASSSSAPRSGGSHNNARLQIFVDPSGDAAAQASSSSNTPWAELGTRKTRIKENVPEVRKASGTTLGRSRRTPSSSTSIAAARIVPYRDPAPEEMPPPPVPKREMEPKTPARTTIVPFRDEDVPVPATPTFTPFRDETAAATPPHTVGGAPVPESVMKVKRASGAEAEALRKDPLKNYGEGVRGGVADA